MRPFHVRIAIVLAVVVATTSGCGVINRIRAKNELNEAARTYREGHYVEAEQHSRRALELDPNNKTAPLFIARTVHAQYRPGVAAPENIQKARDAIAAYSQILETDPTNEEAYKAIAFLYERIKEDEKLRDWILKRANDSRVENEKRAEAYVVLASKDWNCSFQITDLPANKITTATGPGKVSITYKKPANQKDFDTAQACMKRGLEEAENALKFDPNSESAWSYKTNLLIEAIKLAEMEGKTDQKTELEKQREEAQKRTNQLSEANKKKKAEEEAKKGASPPTS